MSPSNPKTGTIPDPLVSCVIPVFNTEKYISEAVESVLTQSHEYIELLVIDDGSTDATPCILEAYGEKIHYIRQKNAGAAAARNNGIACSTGKYLAFLDADDVWHKEKIKKQLLRLREIKTLDVCTTLMMNFWMPELDKEKARLNNSAFNKAQPGAFSMMARREIFDRVGLFNTELRHREAMDWIVRARRLGVAFEQINEILVYRRLHKNNISRDPGTHYVDELFDVIRSKLSNS